MRGASAGPPRDARLCAAAVLGAKPQVTAAKQNRLAKHGFQRSVVMLCETRRGVIGIAVDGGFHDVLVLVEQRRVAGIKLPSADAKALGLAKEMV
ncbi:MAG: hypothetical protein AAGH83_07675 [Pseudomonadota bacterium]